MSSTAARQKQTAYEESRYEDSSRSLRELIHAVTRQYMMEDLGLSQSESDARAEKEIAGTIGQSVCQELAELGIEIQGKRVLDLGAGLGGLCTELALRGASVVGVEPGAAWYKVAHKRLQEFNSSAVIAAVGEAIPLASDSIDVIVSLQVLEHVQNPRQVIQEAFRVLKPGGYFYFSYENYFSFFEPHYRVVWLPLLPKFLGSWYLRLRGRNPQFLNESVTYTTFYGVRKLLAEANFQCLRRQKSATALNSVSMSSLKWTVLKRLSAITPSGSLNLITAVDHAKRFMRTAVYECMRKPAI